MLWAFLVLCCTGLFGYVCYRAIHLSFVHDESLTFTIVTGLPNWKFTANHHPLNTRLMLWCSRAFGNSEGSLRIPNVVSFVLYLTSGLLLLRRLKSAWTIALGFAMLNLNPFLLEFFGLARGYGLASSLSLTAIFLFVEACQRSGTVWFEICLFSSFIFSALADLGNYAWVNMHLALLAGALILVFWNPRSLRPRFNRGSIVFGLALVSANTWFLINLLRRILQLQGDGQLYGGGMHLTETLTSLIQTYLHTASYQWLNAPIGWTILAVLALIGGWLVLRIVKDRRVDAAAIVYGVLVLAVLAPVAEHYVFGSLYPADRTALYYIPLIALSVAFAFDELQSTFIQAASALCVILMIGHFSNTANLRYTLIWKYDANTREAMQEVANHFAESGRTIRIGNSWLLEPGINYYRVSRKLNWLEPATRDGVDSSPGYDVLLSFPSELETKQELYSVVRAFPESGVELMFRKP